MPLVTEKPRAVFNLAEIERGYLLWGRHIAWNKGKAGIVTSATEEQLIVQYYPGIGNVTNHFIIPVSEAAEGQWEIRWSADLAEIWECSTRTNSQQEEEGDVEDASGGTNL